MHIYTDLILNADIGIDHNFLPNREIKCAGKRRNQLLSANVNIRTSLQQLKLPMNEEWSK